MFCCSLRCCLLFLGLILSLAACREEIPAQGLAVCRLTGVTDQLVEAGGSTTSALRREFTYANAQLTAMTEQTPSRLTTCALTYQNGRLTGASAGALTYATTYEGDRLQAITLQEDGQARTRYAFAYDGAGRVATLTETRLAPTGSSLVRSRLFAFTIDGRGNISRERTTVRFADESTLEQETMYEHDVATLAPYARFPLPTLLAAVALSQNSESQPGRFWQRNLVIRSETATLTTTGARARTQTVAVTDVQRDNNLNVVGHSQQTASYNAGAPTPNATRQNRLTYAYQCD